MDPRDAVRDTSGARAYSQFLVEMGERVPAVALPNVSVVLAHLDEEVCREAFVFYIVVLIERLSLFHLVVLVECLSCPLLC